MSLNVKTAHTQVRMLETFKEVADLFGSLLQSKYVVLMVNNSKAKVAEYVMNSRCEAGFIFDTRSICFHGGPYFPEGVVPM